jgi:hypothetical protein
MSELIDFVERAAPLLRARDNNAWELGDLVVEAVAALGIEIKSGRKKPDDDTLTLGEFASQLNQATPRVSEWRKCSALFPPEVRPGKVRAFEQLTWGHYNLARRKANNELEPAMDFLQCAVDLHLGYNAFKRWLNGEIWEGFIPFERLPENVRPFAEPAGIYWATFKALAEEK